MEINKEALEECRKYALGRGLGTLHVDLLIDIYEKAKHGLVKQTYNINYSITGNNQIVAYTAKEAVDIFLKKHKAGIDITINKVDLYNAPPVTVPVSRSIDSLDEETEDGL